MDNWNETANALTKKFRFADFRAAFAFITRVADAAERMDHHPTWTNKYNVVDFSLSTHDAGNTVTKKDRELSAEIDLIYTENFEQ